MLFFTWDVHVVKHSQSCWKWCKIMAWHIPQTASCTVYKEVSVRRLDLKLYSGHLETCVHTMAPHFSSQTNHSRLRFPGFRWELFHRLRDRVWGNITSQDQPRVFACSSSYLMGRNSKLNNRNREESGKGREVDQQTQSKLPPNGWQGARHTKLSKNAKAAGLGL